MFWRPPALIVSICLAVEEKNVAVPRNADAVMLQTAVHPSNKVSYRKQIARQHSWSTL